MKWYQSGLSKGILCILGGYDKSGDANGFLVHFTEENRTAVIFADHNFIAEKSLFDAAFKIFSSTAPYLLFESGYPTPWISQELSDHAVARGFSKYDRQYMRLNRNGTISQTNIGDDIRLVQFSESLLGPVSALVFKCVEGTDDQDLFPFVYGSYESILNFHQQVLSGNFGTHKPGYSWVLMKGETPVGFSLMTTTEIDSGDVMHLAISPEWRQRGLGRFLLVHSIQNLFGIEPELTKIDLAVTNSNPARLLYESIGFKKVNDFSNYLWKKGG